MLSYKKMNEIREYIRYNIFDEIRNLYPDLQMKEIKEYSIFDNFISVQWFFDEALNSVFIWYEIDKYARNFLSNWESLCIRINARLTNNMMEYFDMNCNIISPTNNIYMDKEKDEKVHSANAELRMIRPTTYTCWRCNGSWEFIEYNQRFRIDFNNCVHQKKEVDKFYQFIEELKELNNRYNNDFSPMNPYNDKNSIQKGFGEFADIYKKWSGIELKPVDMDQVQIMYLRISYNKEKEN